MHRVTKNYLLELLQSCRSGSNPPPGRVRLKCFEKCPQNSSSKTCKNLQAITILDSPIFSIRIGGAVVVLDGKVVSCQMAAPFNDLIRRQRV